MEKGRSAADITMWLHNGYIIPACNSGHRRLPASKDCPSRLPACADSSTSHRRHQHLVQRVTYPLTALSRQHHSGTIISVADRRSVLNYAPGSSFRPTWGPRYEARDCQYRKCRRLADQMPVVQAPSVTPSVTHLSTVRTLWHPQLLLLSRQNIDRKIWLRSGCRGR